MSIPTLPDPIRLAAGKMRYKQLGHFTPWDNLLQEHQQLHINCGTNIVLAAIEAGAAVAVSGVTDEQVASIEEAREYVRNLWRANALREREHYSLIAILDKIERQHAALTAAAQAGKDKYQDALEQIALLDEADGHELSRAHAFQAVAIATTALGKSSSAVFVAKYEGERVEPPMPAADLTASLSADESLRRHGGPSPATMNEYELMFCFGSIVMWWDGLPPNLRQDIEGSGAEPGCITKARRLFGYYCNQGKEVMPPETQKPKEAPETPPGSAPDTLGRANDGWQLVPKALDDNMREVMRMIEDGPSRTYDEVWRVQLAASPSPPAQSGEGKIWTEPTLMKIAAALDVRVSTDLVPNSR